MKIFGMVQDLEAAYSWFNSHLFEAKLPEVVIVFRNLRGALGYFRANEFKPRNLPMLEAHKTQTGDIAVETAADAPQWVHELAMCAETFQGRTDLDILSTLVHEMCHVWQQNFGAAPQGAYHNKEWATKMEEVGLTPYCVDSNREGKRTGRNCTHNIMPGGKFEIVAKALQYEGWKLRIEERSGAEAKSASKDKPTFTCPNCGQKAWGKPSLYIICGDCHVEMRSNQ